MPSRPSAKDSHAAAILARVDIVGTAKRSIPASSGDVARRRVARHRAEIISIRLTGAPAVRPRAAHAPLCIAPRGAVAPVGDLVVIGPR